MNGKVAYPVILKRAADGYYVEIPDFDIGSQGTSIVHAMEMARDAIGLVAIDMEDDGKRIPEPYTGDIVKEEDDILTLVDVDFAEYRRKVDNRAVKKNCTLPYWLSVEADKKGLNYSRVLQEAIMNILGISRNTAN